MWGDEAVYKFVSTVSSFAEGLGLLMECGERLLYHYEVM